LGNALRPILCVVVVATLAVIARPVVHIARTAARENVLVHFAPAWAPGGIEDASRLDRTPVLRIVSLPGEEGAAVELLRRVLDDARTRHLPVSIAGARHSMGGQTVTSGGIVVDMLPLHDMQLDQSRRVLHVQAGARWEEVIPFLGAHGLAVSVMQSDSPFTVGGSLSVNCHGWQNDRPPIASTVESFRLMLADGRVVRCSRTEHPELFAAALGGYGLFGIILDADLSVVPDAHYRVEHTRIGSTKYVEALDASVRSDPVGLAYGRLNVTRDAFLERAVLTTYVRTSDVPAGEPIVELAPRASAWRSFSGARGRSFRLFFFSQARTPDADAAMQALTRELIEASLAVGGRYYLPYRLHATREQFARAYPMQAAFFGLKRTVDPDEVFQNQFYRTYGDPRSTSAR
jgi:FAD/FMN-containing dehydrogenase